jgi:hypothetical protein
MNTKPTSTLAAVAPATACSGSSDVEIPCPNGCDGLCSLSICGLCGNTGWVSTDRAAEHAKKQARRPITVEMKRAPFRIQNS